MPRTTTMALTLGLTALILLAAPVGSAFARRCACIRKCCLTSCLGLCFTRPACEASCASTCTLDCGNPDLDLVSAFDPTATILSRDGRSLTLSGPIACPAGARIERLRVTVTQDGSVAEGSTHGACEGGDQQWHVDARAPGRGFIAGSAQACGLAVIETDEGLADTHQWCRDIVLEGETD